MSIHQIARATRFSRRSIVRWIRKSGCITLRTSEEINAQLRKHPLPERAILHRLYWVDRLSMSQIGRKLGATESWVWGLMNKYDIPRRTSSEAGIDFPKTSFSGSPAERAYLIGFRTGDLHAIVNGSQIKVSTSTTHPRMWDLVSSLFGAYGRVNKTPARLRDSFEWATYAYLDRSFDFLLKKPQSIPIEILGDHALFFGFLSGYIDAEGNFRIYGDGEYCAVSFRINSEDERILRGIRAVLSSMGYHVYFRLEQHKGSYTGKNYRKNVWQLGMFRKGEILDLVHKISLRHSEKVEWVHLIQASDGMKWSSMSELVKERKKRISQGVSDFVMAARDLYTLKHRSAVMD